MRKVIKNKVYDTDKSERVCKIPGNMNEAATLYKKKGANSFFTVIDRWGIVKPLKWSEARELIYQYGARDQYCKYFTLHNAFGIPLRKQRTNLDMDKETYAMLRILAGEHGSSVKGYMRRMIHDRYRAYEKREQQRGTLH